MASHVTLSRMGLVVRIEALATLVLVACSPAVATVTTGGSGTSSGSAATTSTEPDTTSADSSTTEATPEPLRFATLAIDEERLCAITEPDRRIVCRDIAQCDAGRDPAQWDLANAECWRTTPLPDVQYAMLAVFENQTCGLRVDDGRVECDYGTAPQGSGYVDLAISAFGACATNGEQLDCGTFGSDLGPYEVTALDGHLVLTTFGLVDIFSILGCTECLSLAGTFVDVFGAFDLATAGCGLFEDGTVQCTGDPIEDERPIAQIELHSAGERCIRFEKGEVECTFEPAPPAEDFVEIAMSATPVEWACGVRTDGEMVCWGGSFDWCGQYLCLGIFECIDEQCYDCTEGCEQCGDTVCQGQSCIEGACVTCDIPPCVACGDDICNGNQQCLDGECFFCGDDACVACGATYCDIYHECVDGECV